MVLPVLCECINNAENVAVFGFQLILCDNMDIFHRFRPSAIFYTTLSYIIPTLKYEPANGTILTVVDYSVSRDAPSFQQYLTNRRSNQPVYVSSAKVIN